MSLIPHLSTSVLDITSLVSVPLNCLQELYPLPPKLASIHSNPNLTQGLPNYKFEAHHLTNDALVIYVLEPAVAGKLWEMGISIANYIAQALLGNTVPVNNPVSCSIPISACQDLNLPPPGILDPCTTGRTNLLVRLLPIEDLRSLLNCMDTFFFVYQSINLCKGYKLWVLIALDWIILAKHHSTLAGGHTNWIWPDNSATLLALPSYPTTASRTTTIMGSSIIFGSNNISNAVIPHPVLHSNAPNKIMPHPTCHSAFGKTLTLFANPVIAWVCHAH